MAAWYGASRQSIRDGIRLLDHVRAEFVANHRFRDESRQAMKTAFGPEVVEILTEWVPSDYDAVFMAKAFIAKARDYKMSLPAGLEEGSTRSKATRWF